MSDTHTHTQASSSHLVGEGVVSITQKRNSTSEKFSSLSEVSDNSYSCVCSAHALCPALGEGFELLEVRPQLAPAASLPPGQCPYSWKQVPPAAASGWTSKVKPPLRASALPSS